MLEFNLHPSHLTAAGCAIGVIGVVYCIYRLWCQHRMGIIFLMVGCLVLLIGLLGDWD